MKILLAAVNAKYIHSNLAVYCLKSYAASKGQEAEIAEYTIISRPVRFCGIYMRETLMWWRFPVIFGI